MNFAGYIMERDDSQVDISSIQVTATGSFLSANDSRAHFGLGTDAEVKRITVRWPDGSVRAYPAPAGGGEIVLRQAEGTRKKRAGG